MKSSRDLCMGYEWCKKNNCQPDPKNLDKTHIHLIDLEEMDKEDIFHHMQGEVWSPKGEARPIIQAAGVHHTSMSVGDIIKQGDKVYMVDSFGFKELTS